MQSTRSTNHAGYTLHVITTKPRTHVARLLRPDGCVVSEWTTTCTKWGLKRNIAQLRESIESSLGTKAILPVYYGKAAAIVDDVALQGTAQATALAS